MHEGIHTEAGWLGQLRLGFSKRAARTVLHDIEHVGPLRMMRAHYSEGPEVCHAIVVHPSGGVVGGDRLQLELRCDVGARAQITTPGATKIYRTKGPESFLQVRSDVRAGACLEYIPLETLAFSGCKASLRAEHELHGDATLFALDVTCFGRPMSGERFAAGHLRQLTTIRRDGRLVFIERARIDGASAALSSLVGLAGHSTVGTLYVAATTLSAEHVAVARDALGDEPRAGVTALPGLLLVRALGDLVEPVHACLERAYHALRPLVTGLPSHRPRIWNT